jgi:hypothetical protein
MARACQLDRAVGELTQDVVWEHGLRSKDAVDVATALKVEVDQLDTFRSPLSEKSGQLGNPTLKIRRPYLDGQLFPAKLADQEQPAVPRWRPPNA